ncbi:MAG: glucuronate isomerase [Kiritimatiellae bacterium]|nr:glucuronate isomerase [Kiritimatiellia bacterium]
MPKIGPDTLAAAVRKTVEETPVTDIHTHVYDAALGPLLLWGIDELLTYHYLVAEVFRARPDLAYDAFWAMSKPQQADLIWAELFVKRSPVSESCRGVLTVLKKLGLDANTEELSAIRAYFAGQTAAGYIDTVFSLANVSKVYMTNDPMDPLEGPVWEKGFQRDPRFLGVLRVDSLVMNWPDGAARLKPRGYDVDTSLSGRTLGEARRYLNEWCDRINARYLAVSLPPSFRYPDEASSLTTLMAKAVFAVAKERGIPSAMMIGVKKLVNPGLQLAGDSVGKSIIETVERICCDFPDVKFLITMLARENMHELCVAARKFKNMVPFGCWWFLNDPSLIREITAMRLELLGLTFVPQHSDARVLDQLIYKWAHSRAILAEVLTQKYRDMLEAGYELTDERLQRDVRILLDGKLIEP